MHTLSRYVSIHVGHVYDLSYLCRKSAGMWVCAWPSDLHAENPSNIAPVPQGVCMWKAIHPVYRKHGWHTTNPAPLLLQGRNWTGFMMLPVPVLVYTGKHTGNRALYCIRPRHRNSQLSWRVQVPSICGKFDLSYSYRCPCKY